MARTRSRFDRDEDVGPKSDVYTGLLALSLIAMMISSLLLFLDYKQYDGMKAPTVSIPQPRGREGVQTGQLPPPLINLPPPAPISERPFTKGRDVAANPVKPVGGEEAQAPLVIPPAPEPPPTAPPTPVVEVPPAPAPASEPPAPPKAEAPPPEPLTVPPAPAPAPPKAETPPKADTPPKAEAPPPAPPSAEAPTPPPLPKSIRSLPN